MVKRFPEIFEDVRSALLGRKPDHQWSESATDAYHATVSGVKNIGGDTLNRASTTLNDALPFIDRAGYDVTEIEVGFGIPPKLVAHLKVRDQIDEKEEDALLAETQDKTLVNTILSSLFKASSARRNLKFKHFQFSSLELEVSLLPSVTLKFYPDSPNVHPDNTEVTVIEHHPTDQNPEQDQNVR